MDGFVLLKDWCLQNETLEMGKEIILYLPEGRDKIQKICLLSPEKLNVFIIIISILIVSWSAIF